MHELKFSHDIANKQIEKSQNQNPCRAKCRQPARLPATLQHFCIECPMFTTERATLTEDSSLKVNSDMLTKNVTQAPTKFISTIFWFMFQIRCNSILLHHLQKVRDQCQNLAGYKLNILLLSSRIPVFSSPIRTFSQIRLRLNDSI